MARQSSLRQAIPADGGLCGFYHDITGASQNTFEFGYELSPDKSLCSAVATARDVVNWRRKDRVALSGVVWGVAWYGQEKLYAASTVMADGNCDNTPAAGRSRPRPGTVITFQPADDRLPACHGVRAGRHRQFRHRPGSGTDPGGRCRKRRRLPRCGESLSNLLNPRSERDIA
jgi:hypothetical protein